MRDADEIDRLYEQNAKPPGPPSVLLIGPVSCVERHRTTVELVSNHLNGRVKQPIATAQQLTYAWAMRYRPESYHTNLMPGLPLWLLWTWSRKGVPCTAVIRPHQLNAFPDMSDLMHSAWDACEEHITVNDVDERDGTCEANGTPISIDHILRKTIPDGILRTRKGELDEGVEAHD